MKFVKERAMKVQADVQSEKSSQYSQLDWVGMTEIQTVVLAKSHDGSTLSLPALLDVGVDLTANHRGIHMSRLYRLHQELILNQPLQQQQLAQFADQSLQSHTQLSQYFACKLKLNWPLQTVSLMSQLTGFRNYPIQVIFEKNQSQEKTWLQFEILYSSTCPQSAGLSMEVLESQIKSQGTPVERLPATPHAQRSRAVVQAEVSTLSQALIESLIERVEKALGTPVQTTVKKADELRFAQLNAENLMFCEDAARKISQALMGLSPVKGFSVYCEHQESLHPHNASSRTSSRFQRPERLSFSN